MNRLGYMTVFRAVTYPIRFIKTLFQLGYQPYPLGPRQSRFFLDHEIYFLPNALVHCKFLLNNFFIKILQYKVLAPITD